MTTPPSRSSRRAALPGAATAAALGLLAAALALVTGCDKHGLLTGPRTPPAYTLSAFLSGTGSGTVTSSPAGIKCAITSAAASGECNTDYGPGTHVALTATPGTRSTFASWGGACMGTESCVVTMSEALTVTATFTALPPQYDLTVAPTGRGSGTVTSTPAGIGCGTACAAPFDSATVVTLTAAPAAGSAFGGWSGACTGTGGCQVTMGEAKSVTATWNVVQFTLAVTQAGNGAGTVTSSPAGLSCGTACSAPYDTGTVVTLAAVPATGSLFAGWSGACSGTGTCQVTMSEARSVTATWSVKLFALTVSVAGAGAGTVTTGANGVACGAGCSVLFDSGTVVTLAAAPAAGSLFRGWSGACTGTGTCQVTMSRARSVTAGFDPAPPSQFALTVATAGAGAGSVVSAPAGIACGSGCSARFDSATVVTLTASPATGSLFAGWSGACTGSGSCQVTMSQARAVTATFNRIPASRYVLTITKGGSGSGTVTSTPDGIACGATCGPSFDSATVVTLAAAPGTGSVFAGWDGPCTGTGTCQVTMSRAWSVTATFNAGYYRLTVRGGGTGSGTVISSPSGISCTFIHGTAGSGCSGLFPYGTTVSLNPVAFDGDNFGGWSGACSGTQACQVVVPRDTAVTVGFTLLSPNTPAALAAASRAANSVVITWRRSPEADLYYLMRSGISGGPYATVHSGRDTTVTDAGLAPSTTYYYVVRAWNSAGWSSFSGELALTTTAGAPLAPTGLAVGGPTATSLAVSWNASAQAAGYQLLRSASATGTYAEVYRGAGRAVTDTGLATGTSYYYRVKAFNAYGASDASETKSGTTLTPAQAVPGVPTGLTVGNPTASSLAIGWSPSALAAGYQLLRSASAAGTYLEVFKGAGTSVTDSGLTAGTTYYYKVRAYSAYGSSDLSDARSGTTLSAAHAPPAVPSGLVVGNPTTSSLAISWSASAQATGYQLKRSTSAAGTYVEVSRGAGTSVSDSGLAAGTTYYYRVRAYNSSGASDLSDYASGTTLAPAAYETAYLKAVFGRGGFYWTTNVAKWQSGTIWIRYSDLVAHHIASPAWSRCYDAVLVLDPHDHDGDGRPSSDHDRQGWSGSDRDRQGSHDGQAWADSDHDRRDDDGRPGSGSDHNRSGDGRSGSAGDHDRRDGGGQGSRDRAEGDSDDAPSFFFSEHAPRSNMGLDLDPTTTSVTVEITGVLEHRDRRDWDGRFWTRGGPWNGRFDFDRPDADCQTLTRTIQIQSLPGGGPARIDIGYWFSDPRVRWGAGIHEVTLTFNGWLVPAGQDATVWRCTGDFNWHGDHEHAYPHGERDRACELKR